MTARERLLTHRWADKDTPHLTIRLAFGPEWTDEGMDLITARVQSAAQLGFRDAEDSTDAGPFERVTVVLTAASSAALNRAVEITGDSKTDTINRALQAYALMAGEVRDGGQVILKHAPGGAK
jgi:hypothetical protein